MGTGHKPIQATGQPNQLIQKDAYGHVPPLPCRSAALGGRSLEAVEATPQPAAPLVALRLLESLRVDGRWG